MTSHITFKRVFAKNFRSINNMGIEVNFKSGVTTLVASTDNGSGKSTIWRDALYYGLFDKPYVKGQKKSSLINSRSGNSCLVEVEFEKGGVEYKIQRGQKPSIFNIIVDGEELNKEAVDFQKTLDDILGFDERLFTNSIVLGADKFVPFTSMGADDRRKFGDQMLDLVVISEMSSVNKEKTKKLNTELTEVRNSIAIHNTNINKTKEFIEYKRKNANEKISEYETSLKELEDKKGDLEIKHLNLQAEYEELGELLEAEKLNRVSIERDVLLRYKEPISAMNAIITEISAKTNNELIEKEKSISAKITELTASINNEQNTIKNSEAEFSKKYESLKVIEATLSETKEKLKNLKEPDPNEKCNYCGGTVGEDFHNKHLSEYQKNKENLENIIKKANELLLKYKDLDTQYAAFDEFGRDELNGMEAEKEKLLDELMKVKLDINSFNSERDKKVSEKRAELTEMRSKLNNELNAAFKEVDIKINDLNSSMLVVRTNIDNTKSELLTVTNTIYSTQMSLNRAKENVDYAKDEQDLVILESEFSEFLKAETDLYAQLNIASLLTKALKDDGIKAKLIENYLPFINSRIAFYLEKMNFFIRVELTSSYELEMQAPERKGQSLENLSSGQQKRIDLAVLFAWRDLARQASTNSCNILILDEILESISESGIIDIMEMWRSIEESKFTNLIVISQRKSEFEPLFDETKYYKLVDLETVEITEKDQ